MKLIQLIELLKIIIILIKSKAELPLILLMIRFIRI